MSCKGQAGYKGNRLVPIYAEQELRSVCKITRRLPSGLGVLFFLARRRFLSFLFTILFAQRSTQRINIFPTAPNGITQHCRNEP